MRIRSLSAVKSNKGFTLIELAIVLAVTSLLTAGLWRMMSTGNTQLRDQAAADKQRELITSLKNYLASAEGDAYLRTAPLVNGSVIPVTVPTGGAPVCAAPNAGLCAFLPATFLSNPQNSYGQDFAVRIRRQVDAGGNLSAYSILILTQNGEVIADTSGGRISSVIGNDGGFVYGANVCGAGFACGAFGTWATNTGAAPPASYGLAAVAGHVASQTHIAQSMELNTPWLARLTMANPDTDADGIGDFNTLNAHLAMAGRDIYGLQNLSQPALAPAQVNYGGRLIHIAQIIAGNDVRTPPGPGGNIVLAINPPCSRTTDLTCNDEGLHITGDATVEGHFNANSLFATQFVYTTIPSDKQLKNNIVQIPDILSKFAQLRGYSFAMKGDDKVKYGVMAQEIEKVFPELVVLTNRGQKEVDYVGLIGPLVESVRALVEENKELKERVTVLEATVAAGKEKAHAKKQ